MYGSEFATELWESVGRSLQALSTHLCCLTLIQNYDQCSSLSVGSFPDSSISVGDVVFLQMSVLVSEGLCGDSWIHSSPHTVLKSLLD